MKTLIAGLVALALIAGAAAPSLAATSAATCPFTDTSLCPEVPPSLIETTGQNS